MTYRVVYEDERFIIQKKVWLFWMNTKRSWDGGDVVEIRSFRTLEEANQWVLRATRQPVPITDAMIDAVYPYVNGSLPLEERRQYARAALKAALGERP